MQMRPRHASRGADPTDELAAFHRVTDGDQWLAQVEVRGDDARAVIDVHHAAGEKERVDEDDDAAVCGPYRIADRAAEVDAQVPRGELAVEHPAGAERAGHHGRARLEKGRG